MTIKMMVGIGNPSFFSFLEYNQTYILLDNETEGTMENDEDDEAATITSKSASSSKVVRVLVKSVNERATREQTERMLIESAMLRGLKHKNINAIMGISICDDVSMSIFPASQLGNLKTFLIEHKPNKRRLSKSNSDESTDQVSSCLDSAIEFYMQL